MMDREQLKLELKQMIIRECEKDLRPEQIPDDAILIGSETRTLALARPYQESPWSCLLYFAAYSLLPHAHCR